MPGDDSFRAKKRKVRHFRPVFKMSRVTDAPLESPSGLLGLVDELLLAILDQIDSHADLCNLAATCSRFQSLAEPYVWRTLLITKGVHARAVAHALDSREERSSYVQELILTYHNNQKHGIEELNHFVGLMTKLRHLTIESPCPNNGEWHGTSVFDGSTRIDYRSLLEASVFPRAGIAPMVPILQSLTIHGHGSDDKKFLFGRSAVMFLHPTLRRIHLSCTDFDATITHESIPLEKKKSTPLQSLTLVECNVNVKFLDVVLSLPKALKELDIGERLHVFPECNPSKDLTTRTSHPLFVDAIARQADSLEKLCHISGRTAYMYTSVPQAFGTSKLRDLTRLRHLELGLESTLVNYLDKDDCPPSLQTLRFTEVAWFQQARKNIDSLYRHPAAVLNRCYKIKQSISWTGDLDIIFSSPQCQSVLETWLNERFQVAPDEWFDEKPRAPVYRLASLLKANNAHLRLLVLKFPTQTEYIPPYMHDEEVPCEEQFYTSEDFWRFGGYNYRLMDDEEFRAEFEKKEKVTCMPCEMNGFDCFNGGDGEACLHCVLTKRECNYENLFMPGELE